MKKVKKFLKQYGLKMLAMMPFYPLLMILTNPYSFIRTIKNYNFFNKEDSRFYTGNNFNFALNNYYYYIQDFNIKKFGRYGCSNLLAGGFYDLRTQFNFTPLSLRMMAHFGTCGFLFICMLGWIISTILTVGIWTGYSFVILYISLTSVLFYVNFFDLQNYNALGWIFLPLAIKGLLTGNYIQVGCMALLMSLSSFTAVAIVSFLAILTSIFKSDLIIFLSVIPALSVFIIPFLKSFTIGGVGKIGRLLGLIRKTKYRRINSTSWLLTICYTVLLWAIFAFVYYLSNGKDLALILVISVIILYWINETFLRFADEQTFFIVYLTVATVAILNTGSNILMVIAFFLSINPIYGLLSFHPLGKLFFNPPVRKPINTKVILDALDEFIKVVPERSKILLAFRNPRNKHWNLFDGHRIFVEPLEYAAVQRDIAVFPDWYFISENNHEDAPEDFWGVEPEEVSKTLVGYKADYVLIYQTNAVLDIKWSQNGFISVSYLNWKQLLNKMDIGYVPEELHWWLLQKYNP